MHNVFQEIRDLHESGYELAAGQLASETVQLMDLEDINLDELPY